MPLQNFFFWALFFEFICILCLGFLYLDLHWAHNNLVKRLLDNHAISLEEDEKDVN